MSNEPRRHHYVPQCYQRRFADVDGCLWLYDRKTERYTKASPKVLYCERELYTFDREGSADRFIEVNWLSQLDGQAAEAIRLLEKEGRLDRQWKEAFCIFLGQLITRSPAFRDLVRQSYKTIVAEQLRIGFSDVNRAEAILRNVHARTAATRGESVTAEALVATVASGKFGIKVTEQPFLVHMVRNIKAVAEWFFGSEWQILRAPSETGYIFCDYPLVVVPAVDRPEPIGLVLPGTRVYFPLTRKLCLRINRDASGFSTRLIDKRDVQTINQNTAINSERFVSGPEKRQLKSLIDKSGTARMNTVPRAAVDPVHRDSDSSVLRLNIWPQRRYRHLPI